MLKLPSPALCLFAGLSIGLSACDRRDASAGSANQVTTVPGESQTAAPGVVQAKVAAPTLAEGPDVCFRAVARQLGANTKVSEIDSFFSVGKEIDSSATAPQGEMTICSVKYQNPSDPRKLLSTSLDIASGKFEPPSPVEITVMGGDESKFRLENYVIPLSQVNAAGLTSIMDAQKPKLSSVYSRYAWSGVRLSAPDAFSSAHTLRLDVTGRLKTNDIKSDGYASVTTDAKTIKTNFLTS